MNDLSAVGLTCEFCGSTQLETLRSVKGQDYSRCRICFGEVQAHVAETERSKAFDAAQDHYYGERSALPSPLVQFMGVQAAKAGLRLLRTHLMTGRLLEVGPGDGSFLHLASESGFECEAVEASPFLAALIADRGLPVTTGSLEDVELPEDTYDAYLSFHVIEHVPDPVAHMRKAAKLVKQGGVAILATPNARCLQHRLARGHSPAYSAAHLRLFSPRSLGELLDRSGWEVVRFASRDPAQEWIRVGTSLLRSLMRKTSVPEGAFARETPSRFGIGFLKIFGLVSWPFRRVQEIVGAGAELVVIARRR